MRAPRRRSGPPATAAAALAAALACATAPPAWAADAGSVSASQGPVRATLSWEAAELGVSGARLVVQRDGVTAFAGAPFPAGDACARDGCLLAASGRRRSPLAVRDLDADGEPEVLVDAFTGGAHCCAQTAVLRRDAAGAYAPRVLGWGNGGYEVRDLGRDGRVELLSRDDAFAAAFTAYAASYLPVMVVRFDAAAPSGLVRVTRRFAGEVRRDLARVRRTLRTARRRGADLRGLVAAEVADLYSLGRPRTAVRTLDAHVRRGDADGGGPAARGRAFRRDLLRFLRRHGYR